VPSWINPSVPPQVAYGPSTYQQPLTPK
jgi:hypothetical protein